MPEAPPNDRSMKARDSLGLTTPFVPPESEIEVTVCGIYSEHLRVAPVGIDDEFFDLGGDSFTAVQISLAIEAATGLQIDSGEIERLASVRAVAALAER